MRPIILYIATTLDGYIAGPEGQIDWLFDDQDYGYDDFYQDVDLILMGRKTWDFVASLDEFPYAGVDCLVFTHNPPATAHPGVTFTSQSPAEVMPALKKNDGGVIWLCGGGELATSFLAAGLVDEMRLFVHPFLLGDGVRLFGKMAEPAVFLPESVTPYESGLIELTYHLATSEGDEDDFDDEGEEEDD